MKGETTLGKLHFASPLLLAPLASITNSPFRLLMEELGAGGTVSELISCKGINYKNKKTLDMLKIDPREKNVGIQLFGSEGDDLALAAKVVEGFGAKFIDINMGCPVKKVAGNGSGAALMADTRALGKLLSQVKGAINIPLTIKIRTGWDADSRNAHEVVRIAAEEGIEFVAIHGRTKAQQYKGQADWTYVEEVAAKASLPIVGNGDLHTPTLVRERMQKTKCQALMLGRGPLRNPFIFLESLHPEKIHNANHYLEVIERFYVLMQELMSEEKYIVIQLRKHIVWFAAGFPGVSTFRGRMFTLFDCKSIMEFTKQYFNSLQGLVKFLHDDVVFEDEGHG